ncbi:helix-turn-helix domain-containing protein [Massilia sp. TS11]|uniref:helix-turn-helix domain-containing protein n=1 Tax=Massilia sp. TS11 TaxID=2908003 RepID=UPI001EDC45A5|nr:helix-turn-helix domain-containing protein [Massilia sp. TS11]MCG2583136.1 helix-turn-helix domain-containing protein [Massilia sp. TS11]
MSAEWAERGPDGAGPGALLAAQRESLGWSVEQVAEQLKLQPRQVLAIEAGDMAALPPLAVVRGFVRAYAKVVRLDPAPLVAMLAADTGPTEAGAAVRRETLASYSDAKPTHGKRTGMPVSAIVAAVVAIGAVVAAYQFDLLPSNSHKDAASAPAPAPVVLTPPAPAPAPAPVPDPNAAAPAPAEAGAAAASVPAAPDPAAAAPNGIGLKPTQASVAAANAAPAALKPPSLAASVAAPAAPAATPVQAQATPPAAQPAAPKAGANTLVIKVREESWVQINPASGGAAWIKRLVKPGATETFEITEPVALVVGNPDGVDASLRGAALALPKVPNKSFARVSIK